MIPADVQHPNYLTFCVVNQPTSSDPLSSHPTVCVNYEAQVALSGHESSAIQIHFAALAVALPPVAQHYSETIAYSQILTFCSSPTTDSDTNQNDRESLARGEAVVLPHSVAAALLIDELLLQWTMEPLVRLLMTEGQPQMFDSLKAALVELLKVLGIPLVVAVAAESWHSDGAKGHQTGQK